MEGPLDHLSADKYYIGLGLSKYVFFYLSKERKYIQDVKFKFSFSEFNLWLKRRKYIHVKSIDLSYMPMITPSTVLKS